MLLPKSCLYALRSSVYLAKQDVDCYVTIKELSDELNISFHFLTKVLQQLTKQEILKSYQGPNGGVKLAKNAEDITLLDIVRSIDDEHAITECALGLPGCGELIPCPLHEHWSGLKTEFESMIAGQSLADLAKRNKLFQLKTDHNKQIDKPFF
jgi:Rrf2 family protein